MMTTYYLNSPNVQKQLKAPFVCYADFECTLNPLNDNQDVSTGIIPEDLLDKKKKRKEASYQVDEPASYAYKILPIDPTFN